jgi:hypothetical protein
MKRKTQRNNQILTEIKKFRGVGSGSLFLVMILAGVSFLAFGLVGGETPAIRSTAPNNPIVPASNNNDNTKPSPISVTPSPSTSP